MYLTAATCFFRHFPFSWIVWSQPGELSFFQSPWYLCLVRSVSNYLRACTYNVFACIHACPRIASILVSIDWDLSELINLYADFTPSCLYSIWFGNRCSHGSSCQDTCLDLFSCCLSNKQGAWHIYIFFVPVCMIYKGHVILSIMKAYWSRNDWKLN